MQIQCECGEFRAELKAFPQNTPGRLKCYCDDCQAYMHFLKRSEFLDENGGTEVIPAYPADIHILTGKDKLKCMRLSSKGMFRFYTSCCNTPIGNTRANDPWVGLHRRPYIVKDADILDQALGPIRSAIMGRYAKGTPPKGTPQTFDFKAFRTVMPFMMRGMILKKLRVSPFFKDDGVTPIADVHVLTAEELHAALRAAGF